jgi:hypothetical protein
MDEIDRHGESGEGGLEEGLIDQSRRAEDN